MGGALSLAAAASAHVQEQEQGVALELQVDLEPAVAPLSAALPDSLSSSPVQERGAPSQASRLNSAGP